jgi:hypothetical protein
MLVQAQTANPMKKGMAKRNVLNFAKTNGHFRLRTCQ